MLRNRLLVAAWLLLLVPTLLIGGLALRLIRQDQERIELATAAAGSQRASTVAEGIELAVIEVREGLLETLRSFPTQGLADRLAEWREVNPLVRNVFVWDPDAGLLTPDPRRPSGVEEASFLRRYEALFEGRAEWGRPSLDSRGEDTPGGAELSRSSRKELRILARSEPSAPTAGGKPQPLPSGWLPWFWEDRLFVLIWSTEPSGERRYGVELETVALLARLLPALPEPQGGETLALLDGRGRVFHQRGAEPVGESALPIASAPVGPSMPHWSTAVYAPAGAPSPAGAASSRVVAILTVGAFTTTILLGGGLLLWQARRHREDARRKTGFVSNVSHELKTPLTTIRMYAELLHEERVRDQEKRRQYLGVIVAESQRLTRLVNNVLDFSRLEQGRKQYHPAPLDLVEVVRTTAENQALRLREAGLKTAGAYPEHPVPVRADRDALEQAVLNLLDNAVKYAAGGGELGLEVESGAGLARVRVLDRGPGVPAEHRKRIFDTFHRVDDSLTARQPGSGLGLSIARRLLRDLGGDLSYRTRTEGGSCFEISLPLDPGGDP